MAQTDWRRYHLPIISAGCVLKPFLYREDVSRWASRMGVKLVGIGNMKCKTGENQKRLYDLAFANHTRLYHAK